MILDVMHLKIKEGIKMLEKKTLPGHVTGFSRLLANWFRILRKNKFITSMDLTSDLGQT